jgi:4-hydroxybenzoate polyprenyltransferase
MIQKGKIKIWLKAIRIHYWLKNLLVFAPLIAAQDWNGLHWLNALGLAICFSFAASGIYLLNDCKDVERDRLHPTKSKRAIASGLISISESKKMAKILISISFCSYFLNPASFLCVLAYVLISELYTHFLKQTWGMDLLTLSCLYILRVQGGAILVNIDPTYHLQGFSFFLFLGLASVKRAAELKAVGQHQGRAYSFIDFNKLKGISYFSLAASVGVFIHYVFSDSVQKIYKDPRFLWGVIIGVMGWWYRIWKTLSSGLWSHDPVEFIWKDKQGWIFLVLSAVSFLIAVGIFY